MNMAGSLLPSEGRTTCDAVEWKGGTLQVVRDTSGQTYRLMWTPAQAAAAEQVGAHPNGYSMRELLDRLTTSLSKAIDQAEYIVSCGGTARHYLDLAAVWEGHSMRHVTKIEGEAA